MVLGGAERDQWREIGKSRQSASYIFFLLNLGSTDNHKSL